MLSFLKSIFNKYFKETGHVFYPMIWTGSKGLQRGSSCWGSGAFSQKLSRGDSIVLNMQSGNKARFLVLAVKNVRTPAGSDHFGEVNQDVKVQPIEYV
jgi:hypothetical protein